MRMRNLFLGLLCLSVSHTSVASSPASTSASVGEGMIAAMFGAGVIRGIADIVVPLASKLEPKHQWLAFGVLGVFALSLAQKENKEFFSTGVRLVEWPFVWTFRKLEKTFTGGQSLTYNHVASWHNRVARILTPLTKTTAMVDLSKDRRLRIMDQEDGQDDSPDDQWKKQVTHIEREFNFMCKVLTRRLAYYKDINLKAKKTDITRAPHRVVSSVGKSFVRTSLIRNEEVAFQLEEAISHLKETVEYCKSVPHFSAIDKEHMKRLMGNICTSFEHLGVLVDELSVADRSKNKIPMTADGSLSRTYSGGSYGSYESGYGSPNPY